jgi:hypothetical protein
MTEQSTAVEQLGYAKDHLLRQIEHLRREVDYDYAPRRTHLLLDQVRHAHSSYRKAWKLAGRGDC